MKLLLAAALLSIGLSLPSPAQNVAPLPVSLGQQSAGQTRYSINASGQPAQNLQQIQLLITSATAAPRLSGTSTRSVTMLTGKQKTVAQLTSMLSKAFESFLAGAAPGTILGTLGNLQKGGTVDWVAESADVLRFDFKSLDQAPTSSRFSRADIAAFAGILTAK